MHGLAQNFLRLIKQIQLNQRGAILPQGFKRLTFHRLPLNHGLVRQLLPVQHRPLVQQRGLLIVHGRGRVVPGGQVFPTHAHKRFKAAGIHLHQRLVQAAASPPVKHGVLASQIAAQLVEHKIKIVHGGLLLPLRPQRLQHL
ncbi:hypothetical protein SDC9_141339 [bioreactor metagenome]|uniref:Uncharacterized protein n=1 Tax=bioreactor metagenome TaxID=1076179 RepID=A0A645DXD7_9ZZZZ